MAYTREDMKRYRDGVKTTKRDDNTSSLSSDSSTDRVRAIRDSVSPRRTASQPTTSSQPLSTSVYDDYVQKTNEYNIGGTTYTGDQVIGMYENIPNYNLLERALNKEKSDAYKTKQTLASSYQDAKDAQIKETLQNAGVETKDLAKIGLMNKALNPYMNWQVGPTKFLANSIAAKNLMDKGMSLQDASYAIGYANRQFDNALDAAVIENEDTWYKKALASEASIPIRLIGSNEDVIDKTRNYLTGETMTADNSRGARAANLATDIRDKAQENLGEFGRFAYGTTMSMADMGAALALGMASGGGTLVSAPIMGLQKASDVTGEAVDRGLNPSQVMLEGVASGVTTALTEAIPLGSWEKIAEKGFAEVAGKDLAKQIANKVVFSMASEGLQEMSEDVADAIADRLIAGDKSEINTNIKQIMADNPGMSEKQAKVLAWMDWARQVCLDGIGGAISGGVIGGGATYIGYNRSSNIGKNTNREELASIISEMDENSEVYKKYQNLGGGDLANAKNAQIGELVSDAYAEASKTGQEKYKQAMYDGLINEGIPEADAKIYHEAIFADKPTGFQKTLLERQEIQNIIDKVNETAGVEMVRDAQRNMRRVEMTVTDKTGVAKALKKSDIRVGAKTEVNGEDAKVKDVKVDGKKITVITDKGEANPKNLTLSANDASMVIAASGMKNDVERQAYFSNYNGTANVAEYTDAFETAYRYGRRGMPEELLLEDVVGLGLMDRETATNVYTAGQNETGRASEALAQQKKSVSKSLKGFKKGTFDTSKIAGMKLTAQQRGYYEIAEMFSQMGMNVSLYNDSSADSENGYYENGTVYINLSARYTRTDFKVDRGYVINTMAHEITHWMEDESKRNKDGAFDALRDAIFTYYGSEQTEKFIAEEQMRYEDAYKQGLENCKTDAERAEYKRTHSEHLSRAGAESEVIARACEDMLSSADTFEKILAGVNANDRQTIINKFKEFFEKLGQFLKDIFGWRTSPSEAARMLTANAEEFEKIRQQWVETFNKAINAMQESREEMRESLDLDEDMTADGGTTVVGQNSVMLNIKTNESARPFLENWLRENSGLTEDEQADLLRVLDEKREMLESIRAKYPHFDKWSSRDSKAEAIEMMGEMDDLERRSMEDNLNKYLTAIVNNSEYPYNFDLTTVCKKRQALNKVLMRIVKEGMFDKYLPSPECMTELIDTIKANGFEVACALCFVDAKRYRVGVWADSVANGVDVKNTETGVFVHSYGWNEIVKSMEVKGKISVNEFNFLNRNIDNSRPNRLASDMTVDELREAGALKLIDAIMENEKSNTRNKKFASAILSDPSLAHTVNPAELISSESLDIARVKVPVFHETVNGASGQATPKLSHDIITYENDILRKMADAPTTADALFKIGGFRVQSFSDYIANEIFDYVQMVSELAANRFPAHAYTKEYYFVKLFGTTGMKINMSIVPKAMADNISQKFKGWSKDRKSKSDEWNYYKAHAGLAEGLNEDGSYDWEDADGTKWHYIIEDESFGAVRDRENNTYDAYAGFKRALEIQSDSRYNKNCGIIWVGVSDAHIRAMMHDSRIPMVIPYHASNINPAVAQMRFIDGYNDYTNWQTEKALDGSGKKFTGFNFYDDLIETKGNVQQTCINYIKHCRETGFRPTFEQFAYVEGYTPTGTDEDFNHMEEGYYKLLTDFRLYGGNADGTMNNEYAGQQIVTMNFPKEFNDLAEQSLAEYEEDSEYFDAKQEKLYEEEMAVLKKHKSQGENYLFSGDRDYNKAVASAKKRGKEAPALKKYSQKVEEIPEETYAEMKEHFGTTRNFNTAGYMLSDGTMLDFSGRHWGDTTSTSRQVDHRDIQEAMPDHNNGIDSMVRMISNGNIRLAPEVGGINLSIRPTTEQKLALAKYINYHLTHGDKEVTIDFDEVGGDTIHSMFYDSKTSPSQIIRDIDNFFNGGRVSELMQFHTMFSSKVDDSETLNMLNKQLEDGDYVVTYKSMRNDGTKEHPVLHSPMAALINGKYENEYELGQWYQAEEHPEKLLVKEGNRFYKAIDRPDLVREDESNLYFNLDKGGNEVKKTLGTVPARYNPYEHSSNVVLNDQFTSAYLRPELVTVEMRIPKSELTSGYKADYAKDAVGWHDWKAGKVAGALMKKGVTRQVLLSRYAMPVRILDDAEVAQKYKELLDGTNIEVPENVVTPNLLKELEAINVPIKRTLHSSKVDDNVGYHAGDLGKDESLGQQKGSNRGTGHFGTGTYFVGNEEKINDGNYGKRPHEKVNFSKYHLYRPLIESEARELHNFLGDINHYAYYEEPSYKGYNFERAFDDFDYEADNLSIDEAYGRLKGLFRQWVLDEVIHDISEKGEDGFPVDYEFTKKTLKKYGVEKIINHIYEKRLHKSEADVAEEYRKFKNKFEWMAFEFRVPKETIEKIYEEVRKDVEDVEDSDYVMDSASTLFMKKLGYEGVDVRHIPSYDNTRYGSVIYDLKDEDLARKKEIGTARYNKKVDDPLYEARRENEALAKRNERLRADYDRLLRRFKLQRKITGGMVLREQDIEKFAGYLLRHYESMADRKALIGKLSELMPLLNKVDKDAVHLTEEEGKRLDDLINDVAGDIYDGKKKQAYVNPESKAFLDHLKKTRLNLSADDKREARNMWDEGAARRFFGTLKVVNEGGVSLDEIERELIDAGFVHFIQESNGSHGDILNNLDAAINRAKSTLNVSEQTPSEADLAEIRQDAISDIGMHIYDELWRVRPEVTVADKYKAEMNKLNAEHKKAMKEIREDQKQALKDRVAEAKENQKLLDDLYYGRKLQEYKTANNERTQKALDKMREQNERKEERLKQFIKDRDARVKDAAERRKLILNITEMSKDLATRLLRGQKGKKVPEALKQPLGRLLTAINYSSKQQLGITNKAKAGMPTKSDVSMSNLINKVSLALQRMDQAEAEGDEAYSLAGLHLPPSYAEKLQDIASKLADVENAVGDHSIYTLQYMTTEQLKDLYSVVKGIRTAINNLNKIISTNNAHEVDYIGSEIMGYLDAIGVKKTDNAVTQFMEIANKTPYYYFKSLGKGGQELFSLLQNGWDTLADNVEVIKDFTNGNKEKGIKALYSSEEYAKWRNTVRSFEVLVPPSDDERRQGKEGTRRRIFLTDAQIMSLYCLSRREQAMGHISKYGIKIEDIETQKYVAAGKKVQKFDKQTIKKQDTVTLSASDLENIISVVKNDPRMRTVAEGLQNFMSTTCSDWGNAVTMKLFGTKEFTEKYYFPIQVNRDVLKGETKEKNKAMSIYALLNQSFTKPLTEGANNEICISDIFDVFGQHTGEMAKYNALALPILDVIKVWNYGENIAHGDVGEAKTVKKSITKAMGEKGNAYIADLLRDLNGDAESGRYDKLTMKLMKKYKTAAVAANVQTALLQPLSYIRAGYAVNAKYLRKALLKGSQAKKCVKNIGVAKWKNLGFYDTNLSIGLDRIISNGNSWMDNIVDKSLWLTEKMDEITWGYLYTAVELEVKDKNPSLTGKALDNAVALRLRDVLYGTQVFDSTLARTDMMRSKSTWVQMETAFGAEPILSVNMLMDAVNEFNAESRRASLKAKQEGKSAEEAKRIGKLSAMQKCSKKIGKASYIYIMASVVESVLRGVIGKIRNYDDDDESRFEGLAEDILYRVIEELDVLNKIPVVKDVMPFIRKFAYKKMGLSKQVYTDTSQMDKEMFASVFNALTAIDKATDSGEVNYKTIQQIATAISQSTGIPIANVIKELKTVYNNTIGWATGNMWK